MGYVQAPFSRPSTTMIIGLVCFCVVMQVLGTTMTLWDFSFQLDPLNAPLLEGFSLPAASVTFHPSTVLWSTVDASITLHPFLREQRLFRPPNRPV